MLALLAGSVVRCRVGCGYRSCVCSRPSTVSKVSSWNEAISFDYYKPLAAQRVDRSTPLAFVKEEVVVGKEHLQADSLATAGQEKVIDCQSVDSWTGNRSLHAVGFL